MSKTTKQSGHKKYGNKLAHPRIGQSKEHRGCGALGYYHKAKSLERYFVTRELYLKYQ